MKLKAVCIGGRRFATQLYLQREMLDVGKNPSNRIGGGTGSGGFGIFRQSLASASGRIRWLGTAGKGRWFVHPRTR